MRHFPLAFALLVGACSVPNPDAVDAGQAPDLLQVRSSATQSDGSDLGRPPAAPPDLGHPPCDLAERQDQQRPADLAARPDLLTAADLSPAADLEPSPDLEPAPIAPDCLVDGDQCGQQVAHRCGVVAHNCGCCGLAPCDDKGQPSQFGRCFVGLRVWSKPGVGFVCVACNP